MARLKLSPEIQNRIRLAREKVASAEREVDEVMREIKVDVRPEKTMITQVLRTAFDALSAAQVHLDKLVSDD
jgi:hypothetical protein